MKILCLHGYGQSEEQAIKTFANLNDFLRKEYKATLYIPIAPFSVTNLKDESGFGWFNIKTNDGSNFFNTNKYIGISDTLKYLDEYMHECTGGTGFDAIIGFSQGSIIASILLSMNEYNFKFGILIGSYPITDVEYLHYDNIKTNILCVWGANDTIVSPDKSLAVYSHLDESLCEKLIHEGRHVIPSNSKHKEIYRKFIEKCNKELVSLLY